MSLRHERPLRVSGGFWLVTAWFGMANGWRLLGTILGAAAVHELGHCLALRCLGASCGRLRLGVLGAVLEADRGHLSYGAELFCIMAGPGANLLCALLLTAAGQGRWDVATGANLVLCVFNLLPLRPLDGGKALHLAVSWLAGPSAGESAARWVGALTGALLGTAAVWVMGRTEGSLWLLPTASAAYFLAVREMFGKPGFL